MTVPGVTFIDHTADVGMQVEGEDLAALFERAARGMQALLAGTEDEDGGGEAGAESGGVRRIELEAEEGGALLVAWLRELLFLHEVEGRDLSSVRFDAIDGRRLVAAIGTRPAARPVREIKGVTYHGSGLRRADGGWRARVIFDV